MLNRRTLLRSYERRTTTNRFRLFRPRLLRLEERAVPATFTVTNIADSGAGSLRQAIADANAVAGFDSIDFDTGVSGTIKLTTGELLISSSLSIAGPGNDEIIVSGNDLSRVFHVAGTGVLSVTISGLSIINGAAGGVEGGGIFSDRENLTLNDCKVIGNTATEGGGIYVADPGTLTLNDCDVTSNLASVAGGIFAEGGAIIQRSTVSGNRAVDSIGGVYARASLLIENSTISINRADFGSGGGVFIGGADIGSYALRNTTISGNTAEFSGGGVAVGGTGSYTFDAILAIQNCTITANTATSGSGGGISLSGTGLMIIESTVVSGNKAFQPSRDIASAAAVGLKTSAIGTSSGFTPTDLGGNLPYGTFLGLGTLSFNGGPTRTHHPSATSPLIDAGSNPFALANDQRGTAFVRVSGAAPDIGAVEVQHEFEVTNASDAGVGSLRQAIANAQVNPGADSVTFDPDFFDLHRTINLKSGELKTQSEVTIIGPGSGLATINAGGASRVLEVLDYPATISGLTITGGAEAFGAGIQCHNTDLTLTDCVVTGNSASFFGGGVYHRGTLAGSLLTLTNTTVSSNVAAKGGGIFIKDETTSLKLNLSTVSDNTGTTTGGGLHFEKVAVATIQSSTIADNESPTGAGVNAPVGGELLFEASTVSGNIAKASGGGLYFYGTVGAGGLVVRNSTFSGNSAGTSGGGIALQDFDGKLTVENSTITNNTATLGAGGGIAQLTGLYPIVVTSSVVSGNANTTAPDISSGGIVVLNNSAVGSSVGFVWSGADNLPFGIDLKLGPLTTNGGPTKNHKPALSSPLADKGSNPAGLTTEQRGPGYPRVINTVADIGSVEIINLIVKNANDSGMDSLRQTVLDANARTGANTITFDSFFDSPRTIMLTTGELLVSESLNVTGPGAQMLTVSGNNASRVFRLNGTDTLDVTLSGMTITKGKSATFGGGIASEGENLTLEDCVVTANTAATSGGGILVVGGLLALTDCSVTNNTAAVNAAGIAASAGAVVERSTISGNIATGAAGGMYARGSLSLIDSTISSNSAGGSDGGLLLVALDAGSYVIRSSTISSNTAALSAGGVGLGFSTTAAPFDATLTVQNSTITANKATTANGGGIARNFGSGPIALESTIVSGNTAGGSGPDLFTTGGVNAKTSLIGSIAGVSFFVPDATTKALLGQAPMLGPLTNNGGTTQTHGLLIGSPAINAGANPAGLTNDQRGTGFPRTYGAGVDIGAFEVHAPPRVNAVVVNDGAVQRSRVNQVRVEFSTVVSLPATPATAFLLRRQSDAKIVQLTVDLTQSLPSKTVAVLTFDGVLSQFQSLEDGRYTLTVFAAQTLDGSGQKLDGNGDGTGGDNYVLASTGTTGVFRMFGDNDGDADVDATDFAAFRLAFGASSNVFDFDNDGDVDATDFGAFRQRFGSTI